MHHFLQALYFASLSPLCCPFYLQFYFPGSFRYLPFPSLVKFSLPITTTTLPLFAPTVFCPQGVLSQSEANLPNYKPHLLLSSSRSLPLPRSSPQFYRYTEAKARKTPFLSQHIRYTLSLLFLSHLKKPIMHTSSLLPSFSPLLPPFSPSSHRSGNNNNQKTMEGEEGTIED